MVMVGGIGVGGGFVNYVMYVLGVCHLVCYVVRSWGFNVYVVGWSEECKYVCVMWVFGCNVGVCSSVVEVSLI